VPLPKDRAARWQSTEYAYVSDSARRYSYEATVYAGVLGTSPLFIYSSAEVERQNPNKNSVIRTSRRDCGTFSVSQRTRAAARRPVVVGGDGQGAADGLADAMGSASRMSGMHCGFVLEFARPINSHCRDRTPS
jgi:hypothetical protein